MNGRRLALGLALAVVTGACHSGGAKPKADAVRTVVEGPVAKYREIVVVAGDRRVVVPNDQVSRLAPLLAARAVPAAEPLASYGLDPPRARVEYATSTGAPIVVDIGTTDFDHHFVYVVRRPDRTTIDLVPNDVLAPVLRQVGIDLPPPA